MRTKATLQTLCLLMLVFPLITIAQLKRGPGSQTSPPPQKATAQTPAARRSLPAIPATMESRAVEILNNVSLEARSWIADEARELTRNRPIRLEAINSATKAHFGSKKQLTAMQQDAVALAVLY